MAILSANTNPKLQEERKAAENAKAILGTLTPSSARTDRTIFVIRYAANLAKTGTLTRLESRQALDSARHRRQPRSTRCASWWIGRVSLKMRSIKR